MSTGRKLNAISVQLRMLLRNIDAKLLGVLGTRSTVAPHQYSSDPLLADLNRWQQQLRLMKRELERTQSSLEGRQSRVASVPRAHRYRAQQSIDSGRDSLAEVSALAARVESRLTALIRRILTPDTNLALAELLDNAVGTLEKAKELETTIQQAARNGQLTRLETQEIVSVAREYRPAVPHAPAAGGGDILVTLTLLMRIAQMAVLAARRNKDA